MTPITEKEWLKRFDSFKVEAFPFQFVLTRDNVVWLQTIDAEDDVHGSSCKLHNVTFESLLSFMYSITNGRAVIAKP